MSKNKLKEAISQQLNNLEEVVEKVRNTGIDAEDETKWDYDYYSSLQSKLEEALALFKNKELVPRQLDEYGDPIISEKGILTLLDEWKDETSKDDE